MKQERIKEILKKFENIKIAVYGDFCLDVYWDMDLDGSEVSVETGLKAESVAKHAYSPGGAGNIVANVAALSPKSIKVIGVVGADIYGNELRVKLEELGADISALTIQKEDFNTYTYIKKMYGEREDPRIDFGLNNKRSRETDQAILQHIQTALEGQDVLIFNQQVVGSIPNEEFIEEVNMLFEEFNDTIVILDSRHYNDKFKNVYRKSNEIETAVLNGQDVQPQDFISFSEIKKHGSKVYEQYNKPLFVTCGSRGVITFDSNGINEIPGVLINGTR